MTTMDLSVVLTSAAVSAVVSGLFAFVSQCLERRARRQEFLMKTATEEREFRTKTAAAEREFLMKTATDWAIKHWEQGRELSKQGIRVELPALGWLAYDYYQQLGSLMMDGKLPPEVQQAYHAWLAAEPKVTSARRSWREVVNKKEDA